ncbi:MAG TPA: hypothetical protein VF550_08745, partial [Polyangia bacterium]
MNSTPRALLTRTITLLILSAAGTFADGCKAAGRESTAKSEGTNGESAAGAGVGPCAEFVNAICGKAGKESASCQGAIATAVLLSPSACKAANKDVG